MKFKETPLAGAYIIELDPKIDERGFFSRTFCAETFHKMGLVDNFLQSNISLSKYKHTLRGMHYQMNGHEEVKLVRCSKGRLLDVIIDLRPESATFLEHFMIELSEENLTSLYVPQFFAHGFLTLEANTEISYQVSSMYSQENERGLRWDDPTFKINWPIETPKVISEKDANHLNFEQ